jgi:hypothetical protein
MFIPPKEISSLLRGNTRITSYFIYGFKQYIILSIACILNHIDCYGLALNEIQFISNERAAIRRKVIYLYVSRQ